MVFEVLDTLYPPKPTRGWHGTDLYRSLLADSAWIVEPKSDGDRCLVVSTANGIELRNRHGGPTRYTWLDGLRAELEGWGLPVGCIIDCELLHEPRPAQDLVVFDVPTAGGVLAHRRKTLRAMFEGESFKHIRLCRWLRKREDVYERAIERGEEGLVFKRLDSKYEWQRSPGLKVPYWVKIKPERHYETKGRKR